LPPDGRDTLLRVPDCSLTDAVLPKAGQSPEGYLDFFTSLQFASSDGAAIVEQTDRRTSVRTWLMLVDPGAPLQPLARDVVYVLRTDTGADVFRTYLPRYTRSQVVFFEGGLFGYSNLEGTRMLKMPEAQ
jgi:hypothetical protein